MYMWEQSNNITLTTNPERVMMVLTLTNTYHNTSTTLRPKQVGEALGAWRISKRAWNDAHKRLCGMSDCECGGPGEFTGPDGRWWAISEEGVDHYIVIGPIWADNAEYRC